MLTLKNSGRSLDRPRRKSQNFLCPLYISNFLKLDKEKNGLF